LVEGEKKFSNAGSLKVGSYVLIDDFACTVKNVEKSKPGKHGSAKVRVTAIGLFDSQKRNLLKPVDADVEIPIIQKAIGQVIAVMGDVVQVMNKETYETFNLPKPKDITGLASGVEVEYHQFGEKIKIVRKK